MLRVSLTAAALSLAILAGCGGSGEPLAHSCVSSDQQFIQVATIDVTAFVELENQFRSGAAGAEDIALEAFDAAARVGGPNPKDPALQQAQKYLDAMFTEYAEAVTLSAEGRDPGERMLRAYGLANGARDVLAKAQPALQREGCNVAPLL